MKNLLKLILISFVLFSCSSGNNEQIKDNYSYEHNAGIWTSIEYKILVKEIDQCEYIIIFGSEGRNIIHKENCKNPEHRLDCK